MGNCLKFSDFSMIFAARQKIFLTCKTDHLFSMIGIMLRISQKMRRMLFARDNVL